MAIQSFSLSIESQTEIVGFSSQSIKEYIRRYFGPGQDELDSFMLVESLTDDSLSICCVPLNCLCMCSFLKWLQCSDHNAAVLEKEGGFPESITQLYMAMMQMVSAIQNGPLCTQSDSLGLPPSEHSLCEKGSSNGTASTVHPQGSSHQFASTNHVDKPSPEMQGTPHTLAGIHSGACALAMRSIDEGNVTFTGDELRSVLSDEVMPIYFQPIVAHRDTEETHFSFRWVYLQEFLAACFIVSDLSLKRFEDLVEQVKNDTSCKRDQVLQFSCGLLFQQS